MALNGLSHEMDLAFDDMYGKLLIFVIPAKHKRSIIMYWQKWIGLLLVLH